MVLHKANFEIPARFSFQPFPAEWRFATAETVEWVEEPKLRNLFEPADGDPEKNRVRVGIEVPEADDNLLGLTGLSLGLTDVSLYYTVIIDRASIPSDVLQPHENYRNTPDISGRTFRVLIYQNPEIKNGLWALEPGEVEKNAWFMCDEFLNLEAHPRLGWDWSVQQFLSKWGLWHSGRGYAEDWHSSYPQLAALYTLRTKQRTDKPDFVMVVPHWLKAQQERYRKAVLSRSARPWLLCHPLSLSTAGEFPFFRVRTSYCNDAVEATITIDHLAGIKRGICKRCHKVFQKETRHKKNYCSERCFNAAGVQRWRENQRKKAKKGAKRNAKG